jgi:LysM repeat protein
MFTNGRKAALAFVAVLICASLLVGSYPASNARAASGGVHIVQPGETLSYISSRYGVSVSQIVAANHLANPNFIWVGQRLLIPGGSAGSGSAGGSVYVVRPGDTLTIIALRYRVSTRALAAANGISNWNLIYVGQRLTIPGRGDPSPTPKPATSGRQTYVVRPGDTLVSIAYRYGSTVARIAAANGIRNPSLIYIGQVLVIPNGNAPAPSTPTPPPVTSGTGKKILVDISQQRMYVYQNGKLIHSWVVSTGRYGYPTRTGVFHVQSKVLNAYGSRWRIWMPYWLGIYWAGSTENGIHGQPINPDGSIVWAGWLGRPITFGCVMLRTDHAKELYYWADIGTPVIIRP